MTDQERALHTIAKAMGFEITTLFVGTKTNQVPENSCLKFNEDAIAILNKRLKAKFRPSTLTTSHPLNALRVAGYTLDDISRVVNLKATEWEFDPNMKKHLVPATLFRFNNFEKYLDATSVSAPANKMYELLKDDWNE